MPAKKQELLTKILEHELVPKHEILAKKQADELLKTLGININQLPKIKETDAVCELIKAKSGNIVKITRKSQTAGEAVFYRAVTR